MSDALKRSLSGPLLTPVRLDKHGPDTPTMVVKAIQHGTVIDHIPVELTLTVAALLASQQDEVLIGMNFASRAMGRKGVVKITGRELDEHSLGRLALVAPTATLAIIRDYQVVTKSRIPVPERFEGLGRCPNPNCITNHEPCPTRFDVREREPLMVRCHHCERSFPARDIAVARRAT
jgi:aspartate carbamoyltransferase regulatory subunit